MSGFLPQICFCESGWIPVLTSCFKKSWDKKDKRNQIFSLTFTFLVNLFGKKWCTDCLSFQCFLQNINVERTKLHSEESQETDSETGNVLMSDKRTAFCGVFSQQWRQFLTCFCWSWVLGLEAFAYFFCPDPVPHGSHRSRHRVEGPWSTSS